jgi:hypothetical protein
MRFHKLRIAFSVFCGIACVLLICLWARSYWWSDMASRRIAAIWSTHGCVTCLWWKSNPSLPTATTSVDVDLLPVGITAALGLFSFDLEYGSTGIVIQLPHWTLVLMTGICGAAPWIRQLKWRFSLRTLLIAITLVAVVLGLIVYAVR